MDKHLVKFYLILIVSLILVLAFQPALLGKTSELMTQTMVKANLLTYRDNKEPAVHEDKGNVIIVMDDGWDTQYTRGYSILSKYGFRACIAVIPSAVDMPDYISYSNLAKLYMNGWDMLNHTYSHIALDGQTEITQLEQITMAQDWLNGHLLGRGSNILVYPQGEFTDDLKSILKDNGFIAARSLKSLWTASSDSTLEDVDTCNLISDITVDTVTNSIDKAVHNKSTVILILHKIEPVTTNTQMQFEEEKFKTIVEYIAERQDVLQVVTMTEFLASRQ